MQTNVSKQFVALILCLGIVCGTAEAAQVLRVERSKTRVGIARVVLNIADLALTPEGLTGDYAIRIPLAPFMDDTGTIRIPLDRSLEEAVASGSTLSGTASSREDGRVHEVTCTFGTSEKVKIVVTTPDRVLSFEAPYALKN